MGSIRDLFKLTCYVYEEKLLKISPHIELIESKMKGGFMKKIMMLLVLGCVITFLAGCETHIHETVHEGTVVSEQMIVE